LTPVCFFGAWDPAYPRNRILRDGLRLSGVEVLEARVRGRKVLFRYPALALAFMRRARRAGIVLVPEFRHKDMPLARLLAGRRKLVFDPLVSRHDTLVGDWGLHASESFQARWNLAIDRAALGRADLVLCDTWAHGALYESLGLPRARLARVLVGAETMFFEVPPPRPAPEVRIVYVGGFLPLHGTLTVVEALGRLERERAVPAFRCELAGTGIEFEAARRLARESGLERTEFTGRVAYEQSPELLARAHIVLGAFGAGAKAGRVIPHKVYQGVAAGRAVVTGDGPGLREVFEPGRHLCAVPRGDAAALAGALSSLIRDGALRERLGAQGRARALEVATPERIGAGLKAELEKLEAA
jgi:glycosyltransferase involved in cell wall biosynthesis